MPETTETTLGFPLKGTLRRSPFPKIVRQLARTKSTGSLYLLNGKTKKVVFFNSGEPISVRSNVTAECLGQILAREGLITQAQCDQTLESIRRTGKKQGELLVEMGILSEGNLRYGLEAQLRHKLYDIFSWGDGRYQYKPEVEGDDYGLRFSTQAQALILNALLETADEAHAERALQPYHERFPIVDPEHGVDLEVTPEENYFLACLDGSRAISKLLSTPSDPVVPSAPMLLYASIQAGIAKLAKSRRDEREPPPKPADGRLGSNDELDPGYEPRLTVTTYEDTPLPGELPKPDEAQPDSGDDEFSVDAPMLAPKERDISSVLIAAERDTPDEIDDELELNGDLEAPAGDDEELGQPLVADPAESGVFERVLLDDDDDKPFDPGTEAEPEPEPEPEPPPPLDADQPTLDAEAVPADELDEVVEIEELDEIVEIEELDEIEPVEEAASEAELDSSLDSSDIDGDLTLDGDLAAEAEALVSSEDELAALAADLEVDDDLAMEGDAAAALDDDSELAAAADELVDLDDLDDVDLAGLELDPEAEATADVDYDPEATAEADPETLGAMQFADGEFAIAEERWDRAIAHFEAAYEHGIDVAELHTYLAWARFQASGQSPEMAEHALELLAYADEMNPNLAMIHAFRSAVLLAHGDQAGAQDAAQRALDIDPYDELAIDVMDKLV